MARRIAASLASCMLVAVVAFACVAGYGDIVGSAVPGVDAHVAQPAQPAGAEAGAAAGRGEGASPSKSANGTGVDGSGGASSDGAGAAESAGVAADASAADADQQVYVPGEAIVRLGDGCTADALNAYLSSLDFVDAPSVDEGDLAAGFVTLSLKPGVAVADAVAQLGESPLLKGAQPNYRYYIQETAPDVPSASAVANASDALASAASLGANANAGAPFAAGASSANSSATLSPASLVAGQAEGTAVTAADAADSAADTLVPNDTNLSRQWALSAMNMFEAWALARSEGAVGIAVIDEGFNADHEDLEGVVVDTFNATTGGKLVSEVENQGSHGTHVAGVLGAQANNGKGVAGTSYNAALSLVQVADAKGGIDSDDILKAYDHVMEIAPTYNIRVINMSLGTGVDAPVSDAALYDKMTEAYEAGIVTVCAACNVNTGNGADNKADDEAPFYAYPGDLDTAVTVIDLARSGSSVARAGSSNYNVAGQMTKDISAPGSSIYSTYNNSGSSKYGYKTGTSMATPQVAGVLALIFAANPALTPAQAESVLYSTAVDLNTAANLGPDTTFDYETGYGLVDAVAAVRLAKAGAYLDGPDSVVVGKTAAFSVAGAGASATAATVATASETEASASATELGAGRAAGTSTAASAMSGSNTGANPTATFTWATSDDSVATVSASGVVTARAIGSFTLSVTGTIAGQERTLVRTVTVVPEAAAAASGASTRSAAVSAPLFIRGATKMPVRSTSEWELDYCTLSVVSGDDVVSVDGSTVTALAPGTAKLAVRDLAGRVVKTYSVKVYALSGKWRLRSAASSSQYLQVQGDSRANGANVRVSPKRYSGTVFKLAKLKGDAVGLKNRRSAKYVRVAGAKKNKSNAYQYKKTSAKAMRWRMTVDSKNRVTFLNVKTGKALTAASSAPRPGTNVYQYTDKGKLSQKWLLVKAS